MPKSLVKLLQREEDWWYAVDHLAQITTNHTKDLRDTMRKNAAGTTNKNALVRILPPGVVTSASYTWQWTLEARRNRLRYSLWLLRLFKGRTGWQHPKAPVYYDPRSSPVLRRYKHPKCIYNLSPNG